MTVKTHFKKKAKNTATAPVDFVVITALEEERDAFLSKLRSVQKLDKEVSDVHTYYWTTVRTSRQDRSEYQVIVTCLLNTGPINATAQAVAVVSRWRPRYVLLVGIACGLRGVVNHGDILVASQVADYTLGKQMDGRREVRWEVFPCGASLLDSANNISSKWEDEIGEARPGAGKPQRHKGVIASGGDVISDDKIIATYSESWPKLLGIEMESGGVAAGVHQTPDRPEFLMIKSVSDFGKDKHDPNVKPWRHYACYAAATFALNIIKSGPSRSLSEVSENDRAVDDEDDKKRAAERRWQCIQNHPIRGVEILFILKGEVAADWFREILDDTRLTFSRNERSFKLGQIFASAAVPNTREHSRDSNGPVCSFWELYKSEPGYWCKRICPTPQQLSLVAGFDATVPWSMLGVERVSKLEDLALLTEVGVSIPARAYLVGVEEFELTFMGDTFAFSVRLSEQGLEFLHEMARVQHTVVEKAEPMPIGTHFSGVQLLEMFLRQLLPRRKDDQAERGIGMMGLSGPDGKAICFYPTMPQGFNKQAESNEYTFTITAPAEIDFTARIKKLKKKLKKNPTDATLYGELAAVYSRQGRKSDAMQCLETAFKQAPPVAEVHGLMGQFLAEAGRFDEALTHFQKAEALAPDNAQLQTKLGITLDELGKEDVALSHFEAAARIEPSKADYQINFGMALIKQNRYVEAIVPLQCAVALVPDNLQCVLLLGIALDNEGQLEKALYYLEKTTQLAPDTATAHEHLGSHLAKTNQHEKAVASLQRAIAIEESARRYELLGASLFNLERLSEAEEALRRAVDLDPNSAGKLTNLAAIVAKLGRITDAVELCQRAIKIKEYARTYSLLGQLLVGLDRWAEAEAALRRGLELAPGDSEMMANLGVVLGNIGRLSEAEELFERASRMKPHDPTIRSNLTLVRKIKK
jgi:Flp pilus assembly protein TadD/nucleoside phosphorylase